MRAKRGWRRGLAIGSVGVLGGLAASLAWPASEPSELDYYRELPTVLTVTRLAQPLNETPGAVTLLDRETIRRSGARELADLLRLVPGYLTGGFNGANPVAAYHMPLDDYGIRNLVLIDGRPVYSAYYLGGTHQGMMAVLLEDIERIEVLRGANSAAYGANAMFGVINVVTRHSADTRGVEVGLAAGTGAIADTYARIGWGDERAGFRLSTGRRSDDGYRGAYDDKIMRQLHFRSDLRPHAAHEVTLVAGFADLAGGLGIAGQSNNPARTAQWAAAYGHGLWRWQLADDQELKLMASVEEETFHDSFPHAIEQDIEISINGRGRRLNLELQHIAALSPRLRTVWGIGHRQADARSLPLYARAEAVKLHEERLFGNLEWRPHPRWLFNLGGFAGFHSALGDYFSPRLMANVHLAPTHTLRVGYTESARLPNLFELYSDVRFQPRNWAALAASKHPNDRLAALMAASGLPFRLYAGNPALHEERLEVRELGYFGHWRDVRLSLDVRLYHERMRDLIAKGTGTVPGYVIPDNALTRLIAPAVIGTPAPVVTYLNQAAFTTRGLEYQARWQPAAGSEIWLNQAFARTRWQHDADMPRPPVRATTLAWFQKLPQGFELSLIQQWLGALTWSKAADALPRQRRLDLRLAKQMRWGDTQRLELALVVQGVGGDQIAYQSGSFFTLERRAWGTLRLEF